MLFAPFYPEYQGESLPVVVKFTDHYQPWLSSLPGWRTNLFLEQQKNNCLIILLELLPSSIYKQAQMCAEGCQGGSLKVYFVVVKHQCKHVCKGI